MNNQDQPASSETVWVTGCTAHPGNSFTMHCRGGFGADASAAVPALASVALRDPHPQAQQYALKAIKAYGAAARRLLPDLDDLAVNQRVKDYVRRAAHSAAEAIREAVRIELEGA